MGMMVLIVGRFGGGLTGGCLRNRKGAGEVSKLVRASKVIIDVLRGWWFYVFVVSWVGGLMRCFLVILMLWWLRGFWVVTVW